ncbi:MAG: OsmC family protein, partial [Pseudomonadota bacterium]
CFCNDLRYVAHKKEAPIHSIDVHVTLTLKGDPPIATSARMTVTCAVGDWFDAAALINEARSSCMVSNSIAQGIPVSISMSS